MGNCCSCFRAVFKPNSGTTTGENVPLASRIIGPLRRGNSLLPKPPTTAGDDVASIVSVDECISENGKFHHTERFDLMTREKDPFLVIRRGQSFRLAITLARAFNPETDAISFIFTVKDVGNPSYGQGTLVGVPLLSKQVADPKTEWSAVLESRSSNETANNNPNTVIHVSIIPAANAIVGKWQMEIDVKKGPNAVSYTHSTPIFILFNPWSKDDQVYMKDEAFRQEYVLTDTGLIWRGSYNRLRPTVWKFAQFEQDVLECSLYLMVNIGQVPLASRADPVKISRALSAAVNSPDDYGAVMGNWSEDFSGGNPPTKWMGSMKILQKYYKYKKPVKYGQCWVFAGVLTTICRALGLPCRPVTTYSSAHDTQNSLTVDYFIGENGEVMEEMNSDSVWNYHVWNEVWMSRPDLLPGQFDGWQVIDATPQELSDEKYRLGPCSVAAAKLGEVLKPYDSGFVFSEVNADKVYWRYAGITQPLKLINKDIHAIGQKISTKSVGSWDREDITHTYKHPEKSKEERAAMLKALRQSESLFSRYYLNEDFNDILFDFALRDDIIIGQPFTVVLQMKNRSKTKDHNINVILRVDAVNYTGVVKDNVKRLNEDILIKAKENREIKMTVSYDDYKNKMVDQCAFNIASLATVKDTNFEYFAQDDFRVRKPDIKIKLFDEEGKEIDGSTRKAVEKKEITVKLLLKNPLPGPLKKGQFMVEGHGLVKQLKFRLQQVEKDGEATASFKLTPPLPGRNTLAAKFISNELDDVDGFLNFRVEPRPIDANGT